MLTKRMMLAAGALALALVVNACSEDRAGGATGVSDGPAVPPVNPPAPVAIATPATPQSVRPGGDGGTGGGEASTVVSSSYYDGHQVVLSKVTTSSGAIVSRVTLDGVKLAEFSGAGGGESGQAGATAYADGQVLFQETVNVSDAGSIVIPPQYLGLTAPTPGGPQQATAMPCMHELGMFGSASLWLSGALMWAKMQPYSLAAWIDLRAAIGAVGATSYNLYLCLAVNW